MRFRRKRKAWLWLLPQFERKPGLGTWLRYRVAKVRFAALPRQLSHHASVGHSSRTFAVQRFRRDDLSGRRRNPRLHYQRRLARLTLARWLSQPLPDPARGAEDGSAGSCGGRTEIPLVICDIQRGGPSNWVAGLRPEQAGYLLQALFGRNSEAPIPDYRGSDADADCFWKPQSKPVASLVKACMIPVIILSKRLSGKWRRAVENSECRRHSGIPCEVCNPEANGPNGYLPYKRDPQTLARPWAVPGIAWARAPCVGGTREARRYRQH